MEVKTEIVNMRLGFVIGDKPYTFKDGLLRMRKGDIYRLVGYDNKNRTYIGFKVREDRTQEELHENCKLIIYEGDGDIYEAIGEEIRYYFNENDEFRLAEWRCIE